MSGGGGKKTVIEAGDVYLGDSGTLYYLMEVSKHGEQPLWRLLYYNVMGEACNGEYRDEQTMTKHLCRDIYTYVMNLVDLQDSLNRSRLCK